MEITLSLRGQELKILGKQPNLYSGSIGVLYIKFSDVNFDTSLVKAVRFKTEESDWYTQEIIDGRVRVPHEVIVDGGFDVAVGGYDIDDGELMRFLPTNSVHIDVTENGYGEPDAPLAVEGGFESIIGQMDKKADIAVVEKLMPRATVEAEKLNITDHCEMANVIDYKIYGKSVQKDKPIQDKPIDFCSVGDVVENGGFDTKYKIGIKIIGDDNIENVQLISDCQLCGIGQFRDYIDYENQRLVKRTALREFDGSEEWRRIESGNYEMLYLQIPDGVCGKRNEVMCSHFQAYDGNWASDKALQKVLNSSTNYFQPSFVFLKGTHTVETWKAFLKKQQECGKGVKILYPAPNRFISCTIPKIEIRKSDVIQVQCDTAISPSIRLTYYQDINKVISELRSSITA